MSSPKNVKGVVKIITLFNIVAVEMKYIFFKGKKKKRRRKCRVTSLVCQYRPAGRNTDKLVSLILRRPSSPSFTMLPMFSLDVSFLLLFILFHISYQRIGTAFKTSLTGANSISMVLFSKGTLTHQIARQFHSHEYSSHEKTQ